MSPETVPVLARTRMVARERFGFLAALAGVAAFLLSACGGEDPASATDEYASEYAQIHQSYDAAVKGSGMPSTATISVGASTASLSEVVEAGQLAARELAELNIPMAMEQSHSRYVGRLSEALDATAAVARKISAGKDPSEVVFSLNPLERRTREAAASFLRSTSAKGEDLSLFRIPYFSSTRQDSLPPQFTVALTDFLTVPE